MSADKPRTKFGDFIAGMSAIIALILGGAFLAGLCMKGAIFWFELGWNLI